MVIWIVAGFVALVLLVLLVAYTVSIYNQLVSLRERVDQAKQNIDVLLKQRQDELTKLIDAAQEFMDHEEQVLTQLTEAREAAERASSPAEEAAADQQIRQALMDFEARAEAYPDLRSQTNMLQFQERISEIESQIADRREFYNEAVTQNNTRIAQFPYVLIARQFGFQERELFEATEAEKADVDVGAAFSEN
ncbi:lemA-like protein [Salinarchaeum sp. Harcht-Bsk1]|uniref:LemA family protein n=1 Tax=Salinarchaeum sp. Harcht-Bsk1 TaxID=1333523 RepID=UPI0003422AB8|nr:LemA family protein [Salinarchaeum sp. Harcht-Bsk1]AGN00824.1 lemA-like protein [Salinarchaeum sp. Harcht-Bsk1]